VAAAFGRRPLGLALLLGLLGMVGCPAGVGPKPAPAIVDQLELRIDAPGMSPESVEQEVVAPIELALVGNSDVQGMISEAVEGRARIQLMLTRRAELVAVDVLQRLTAIAPQLPPDVEPPVLRHRHPNATTLHFGLGEPDVEAEQSLIRALEGTAGVREVSRCGIEQVVALEIDAEALRRVGVGATEIEAAVRAALLQPTTTADKLLGLTLTRADGTTITLADVASLRTEPAAAGCRAYSERGATVGISVTVAHAEARSSVEAQLQGVALQRFDSLLHLWVTPEFEPERIRELGASAWLLEVGVEADPCAGPGTLARLHLSDDIAAEAIAAVPGVVFVERPEQPWNREWRFGPDAEGLVGDGREVLLLNGDASPQLVVGVEVGRVGDPALPVLLRIGSVRELAKVSAPARICRRNGERGVVMLVRPTAN
jgi:hypothetical protein